MHTNIKTIVLSKHNKNNRTTHTPSWSYLTYMNIYPSWSWICEERRKKMHTYNINVTHIATMSTTITSNLECRAKSGKQNLMLCSYSIEWILPREHSLWSIQIYRYMISWLIMVWWSIKIHSFNPWLSMYVCFSLS